MDFKINIEEGRGKLTLETTSTLLNNVYLSLSIRKGSWWFAPKFGSELHLLRQEKDVAAAAMLAKKYTEEALQWLLDTGRASAVDVVVERITGGLLITGTVTTAAGVQVPFSKFVTVGD